MKKVVSVCIRWGRYVSKYKQIIVNGDEGPVTKKIPTEWATRCLEFKNVVVDEEPRHIGVRKEYAAPSQSARKLRPGSYRNVMREKIPYQTEPSKRRKIVEFKGMCGCERGR